MPKTKSKQPSNLIPTDPVPVTPPLASTDQHACRLLSRQEVLERIGVSYAALWGWIKEGKFPPGRALSPGTKRGRICWIESEIQSWIASRPVRLPKNAKKRAA